MILTPEQLQFIQACSKDKSAFDRLVSFIEDLLAASPPSETALQEQQSSDLLNSVDDMVFTLDREQRHTAIYGRWMRKLGVSPEMFLGRTAREILGDEAAAIHEAANQQVLAGDRAVY